ncbi:DUF3427 domain-containing protein, partial [bacterium]|nr:DUF3427 domain-containing protein [bacterium]
MSYPDRGLHETLITEALAASLDELDPSLNAENGPLGDADAPDRIALYIGRAVRRAIEGLPEKERAAKGVRLAKDLIAQVGRSISEEVIEGDIPVEPGQLLRAVRARRPDGSPEPVEAP